MSSVRFLELLGDRVTAFSCLYLYRFYERLTQYDDTREELLAMGKEASIRLREVPEFVYPLLEPYVRTYARFRFIYLPLEKYLIFEEAFLLPFFDNDWEVVALANMNIMDGARMQEVETAVCDHVWDLYEEMGIKLPFLIHKNREEARIKTREISGLYSLPTALDASIGDTPAQSKRRGNHLAHSMTGLTKAFKGQLTLPNTIFTLKEDPNNQYPDGDKRKVYDYSMANDHWFRIIPRQSLIWISQEASTNHENVTRIEFANYLNALKDQ